MQMEQWEMGCVKIRKEMKKREAGGGMKRRRERRTKQKPTIHTLVLPLVINIMEVSEHLDRGDV